MAHYSNWSEDENGLLKKLCAEGHSYGFIAAMVGRTRNSVISRADRIGISNGRHQTGPARSQIAQLPAPRRKTVARGRIRNDAIAVKEFIPTAAESDAADRAIPAAQRRTLLELTAVTCRWPVGDPGSPDFFFCGAIPREGMAYCPRHCCVAFQPARPAPLNHSYR